MARPRAGYIAAMDTGSTHSPRVDDEMAHEVESLTTGAPVESRADEARAMEDAAPDEPVPESIVTMHEGTAGPAHGLTRAESRARSDVETVSQTGPYAAWRTMSPPHVSLGDRGITMATNHRRGVCARFRHPVAGIEPLGVIRHPGITVTVEDVDGLVTVLEQAIAQGGAQLRAEASG